VDGRDKPGHDMSYINLSFESCVAEQAAGFEMAHSAPPQHEGATMMALSGVIPDRPKA
jgi:hypothetical protein